MKQLPLKVPVKHKTDVRTQFAALPFRVSHDKLQVLLITSRRTKRWIVPKGWPMEGVSPMDAAATEAFEEAGVEGKAYPQCVGLFSYQKDRGDLEDLPCVAMVYPIKVTRLLSDYPEKNERRRKWFSIKKAVTKVHEPELRAILKAFDPKNLHG
ncbi:NUDIX hydrolase [Nereida sp. MMG025]|uniref:NUDIX hydrolase n=1 Tax=Nereida sp. MMG025 TaxID=2909981 RepID=UPI001F1C9D93|nr:NUDIX hydrolase [Nereida sp. MMG025]MCF6445055.1 NUDIX hydrolase [Nereida sp. MMG025]